MRALSRLRLDAASISVVAVLIVVASFYAWTAATSGPMRWGDRQTDKFNRLTDGFLHGELGLRERPAPGLAAIPEDQIGNDELVAPYFNSDIRDLSIYDDRFYLYWGPTPVLTSFLPFRALGQGGLPEGAAVVLYTFAGLIFMLLTLRVLQRRFLPRPPPWAWPVVIVVLALGNVAPFVLRRPTVYEIAVSCGFCFLFAGLWLISSAYFRSRLSVGRLALGSLAIGLAFAARPDMAIGIVAAVAVVVALRRRGALPGSRPLLRVGLAALGPFTLVVALHLVYNALRFSGPLDFGTDYLIPVGIVPTNRAAYLPPGLWYYLLELPRLSLQFPFVFLGPPPRFWGHIPDEYVAEPTGGVLAMAPVVLLLATWPWWRRTQPVLGLIVAAAGAAGAVLMVFLVLRFPSVTHRYELDFLPLWLGGAVLAWWALRAVTRRRRLLDAAFLASGALTAVLGLAVSVNGKEGALRANHPETFADLARFFSPGPTFAARLAGRPLPVAVNDDPSLPPQRYDRFTIEGSGMWLQASPATLQVIAPSAGRHDLTGVLVRGTRMPRGLRLEIRATTVGASTATHVPDGPVRLPITLARGLNDVTLTVTPGGELPIAAGDPAAGQLARFEEMRIR